MIAANLIPRIPRVLRKHRLIRGLLQLPGQDPIQLIDFHNGQQAYADLRDGFMRLVLIDDGYDPDFFRIASPFVSRGGVFLDIGANFGFCSFGLTGAAEAGQLTAFLVEANPELISILQRSADLYAEHDIRIVHACASEETGISRLSVNRQQTGASYVSPDGEVTVNNLVIDQFLQEQRIEQVIFMKMDIEGHELSALRGAKSSFAQGRVEAIYLEVFPKWLERSGQSPDDIICFLESNGFRLFFCRDDEANVPADERSRFADLKVHDVHIRVWPVTRGNIRFNTDILAIHESSQHKLLNRESL